MKRLIAMFLAAVMALSLTACGSQNDTTTAAPETTTEAPVETTEAPTTAGTEVTDAAMTYFSISLGENYENVKSIMVYSNGDGTVHVEYVGDEKKVGDLDESIMTGIAQAIVGTDLISLVGQDIYEEGEANGSLYVEYADGTMVNVGFSGKIPDAFAQGYAVMDAHFADVTADLPVYVAEPLIMGEVDATLLAEITAILNGSGIRDLDMFAISQVMKDEYFAYTVGLTSDTGISSAANCAPLMMTTAYSLVIVTLEEGTDATTVCADFEQNLDWMKWVCVSPSDAMIATKGDMVLCLMANGDTYTNTVNGINAAGWTTVNTLTNPNQ